MREYQSIAEVITHIAAWRVVIYLAHLLGFHVIGRIGVTALVAVTKRSHIVKRPAAAHLPNGAQATSRALAPVDVTAIESVVEVTIGAVVITTNRVCKLLACTVIEV